MSDDLVKMVTGDTGREVCKRDLPNYPCAINCPCALELRVLSDADEIDRLRAENARLKEALVEAMIVPEAFMLSGRPAHMRDDVWEQIQRSVTIARAVIQTKGRTDDQT